ncbi:Acetyltransferase involved in cellulose biosynthesis, CelD/BcsL family [Roseovarius nanhaiticus]|uniref:Acetyltransferase involved in cellulose biosynthesis, CelD/BcsL family n=1 Tax=Roseovarius nanhaiticus TaxID=573024 RepID=A0A1N7H644_9RHOB|nr:GNAT family N-acetyltransferase [Roseovarius nanhaiticus]SEL11366.1 Acetyltransferase involved in cellulose biosynthesis, CelD/BcsL family [Roseovarius nanhaiticus]SIS20336.1 Acetyltransferase involved in cellulose biosynthesis, CelD/BcsL family [Roseovarius nanhaiticus]
MTAQTASAQDGADLSVEIVDDIARFRALEREWKALEASDPEATVFLSWDWMEQAFAGRPYRWSVLVARPRGGGAMAAVLPLKYSTRWSGSNGAFQTYLEGGGRLLHSDLAGLLCDPAQEEAAIAALAARLMRLPWARLSLRHMAQLGRAARLLAAFRRNGYRAEAPPERSADGKIDRLVAPRVALPDSFDDWLDSSVASEVASRYRSFKTRHFTSGAYRFTHSDTPGFQADLAMLRAMRAAKGAQVRDAAAQKAADLAQTAFDRILTAALEIDALFLPILWRGDVPIGALGHVLDPRLGMMHFVTAAQDPAASEPFIAAALHFHSIECAIFLGCDTYDFGRGDEPYKFSYGAKSRRLTSLLITREAGVSPGDFDSICTGGALEQIDGFFEAGKTDRARRACRQLARLFS